MYHTFTKFIHGKIFKENKMTVHVKKKKQQKNPKKTSKANSYLL